MVTIGADSDGLPIQPSHHKGLVTGSGSLSALGKNFAIRQRRNDDDGMLRSLVTTAEDRHFDTALLQLLGEPDTSRSLAGASNREIADTDDGSVERPHRQPVDVE